jgi:hypothetical protein
MITELLMYAILIRKKMSNKTSCHMSLAILWIAFISTFVILPALAALETTIANTIKSSLNNAMRALQSGNVTQAQQPLMQANQSLAALTTGSS